MNEPREDRTNLAMTPSQDGYDRRLTLGHVRPVRTFPTVPRGDGFTPQIVWSRQPFEGYYISTQDGTWFKLCTCGDPIHGG